MTKATSMTFCVTGQRTMSRFVILTSNSYLFDFAVETLKSPCLKGTHTILLYFFLQCEKEAYAI